MKRFSKLFLIFAVSISFAFSQEKLSLQQAITIALDKNIDVMSAKNRVEAQKSAVQSSYGTLLPSVSALAGWNRSGSSFEPTLLIPSGVSARGSVNAGIDASVTIFDGFRNWTNLDRANRLAASTEYDLQKRKQDIALAVQQSYLTVLRNKQLLKVSEDNLKRSQQQLARITELNKVGAVAKADLYRQLVQTSNDELSVISAQNSYENSKFDLLYLLALDVTKEYNFDDAAVLQDVEKMDGANQSEMQDYQKLVNEALSARPDYQSAVLAKDAASNSVTIAQAGHYPSLSLSGGYGLSGNSFGTLSDTKSWNLGFSLRLPLFSGFQTSAIIQNSQLDFQLAEQSMEQSKRKVQKDVRAALLSLETAKKRLDVSSKSVVSAEEDRRIAEERYNLGSNTLLDLLTATANYTQALSNKVSASYDFLYAKQAFKIAIGREKY